MTKKIVEGIREICKRKWIQWLAKRYIYLREVTDRNKEYEWEQISTRNSIGYKHSFSYWSFCYCFKDYSTRRGISEKKSFIKYLKHQINRERLKKKLKIVK